MSLSRWYALLMATLFLGEKSAGSQRLHGVVTEEIWSTQTSPISHIPQVATCCRSKTANSLRELEFPILLLLCEQPLAVFSYLPLQSSGKPT